MTYVDSDDWIDPEAYNELMLHLEAKNADMGIFAMVLEKKQPVVITNYVENGFYSKESLCKTVYPNMLFDYTINGSGVIASLCNKIIRRDILVEAIMVIPDSLGYGEDAIAGYLCMLNASTIHFCDKPYYHYRENLTSISHADHSVMAARILALDFEMRSRFSGCDTDMSHQIDGHIARHTVELVRSGLIYSKDKSLRKRCSIARRFCEQPQIACALEKAYPKIQNRKEKIKVLLIRCRMFRILYLLFRKV